MSASVLTISELVPDGGGAAYRTLILTGPALPFMGAEWKFENNLVTTWYNGNGDEATQQVLGPREMPSHWNGDWRRTMMGRAPSTYVDESGAFNSVIDPHVLVDLLEDIARSGLRLRVTWSQSNSDFRNTSESWRIVREGRVKTFGYKVTRSTDIEWEIEFHWQSRGRTTQKVADTRAPTIVGNVSAFQNKLAKLLALQAAAANAKNIPKNITLGQIEQLAKAPSRLANAFARKIQQASSTVAQITGIAETLANQPLAVTQALVNVAHNTISQANNFRDALGRIPWEVQSEKTDVASTARAARAFGFQADAATDISRSSVELANQLRSQQVHAPLTGAVNPRLLSSPSDILAVYITKDGDTPQRVSQKYYGTPDHAIDLLRANRLPFHQPTFPTGKVLIVPVLSSQGPGSNGVVGA